MEAQHDQEINGSCEKGTSSSSSTLKVKLKIPKLKDEKEDEKKINVVRGGDEDVFKEDENNVSEEKIFFAKQKKDHICCECGKEFSSGKALGGHMSSAHVQANQRLEESWKKKKSFTQEKSSKLMNGSRIFEEEGVFNNNEQKIICDLCGKSFPSKKSLFGHMRCHPDRDWRGMKPPTSSKRDTKNRGFRANFDDDTRNNDDEDDADDYFATILDDEEEERSRHGKDLENIVNFVVAPPPGDLKDCLKGWGVTDRRGRSPLRKKRNDSSPDQSKSISSSDEKELHDAVHQLIRLVNGDGNNNNNNDNSEVLCSSNSVGTTTPKEVPLSSLKDKSKRKVAAVDDNEENRGEICSSPINKKRRREKQLIKLEPGKDVRPSPGPGPKKAPEVKFKCNICGKSFTSHQALGGHRSSHNKFKITIENTIDHPQQHQEIKARNEEHYSHDHEPDVQLGEEINNFNFIEHGSNNVHKCKICDKIFSTGQALGGHQKSHWTNNQNESANRNASKVLDFDLNELPDVDDCDR
ncbi:zinc finger protein ZAT9-like [Lycium barbarum]|uniref:zinc finger protein ZAT9-like n=1 Tax=Lycium barbarum TaxID=112863 RepID=UPI00293EB2E3|nr:zinc finger protein ZAT9-like [Lycium barbarum]